jgi:hypothetical protein
MRVKAWQSGREELERNGQNGLEPSQGQAETLRENRSRFPRERHQ